jgi:uncharacterized protein YbjT (DUF2867 family)
MSPRCTARSKVACASISECRSRRLIWKPRSTPAAVAHHHGVEAFVNMSQMTIKQMSITETNDSPQHKLHWLAELALSWSGLPVVTVRPTVFLEGFFLRTSHRSTP